MSEPLTLYLAAPRGFCAGVDRAIKIVELALEKWGAPVYVRHEIVHNRHVVDGLRAKGAVFVEDLDDCPTDRPVIFSAHGVPKAVPAEAEARAHDLRRRHLPAGLQGPHRGRAPPCERSADRDDRPRRPSRDRRHHGPAARPARCCWSRPPDDVAGLAPRDPARLAFVTQTTLSVDDTADDRRGAAGAVPRHRRPAQGGHLLRHHQPPGGGQGDGAADRRAAGDRRAELVELAAPRRGRPSAPAAPTPN